MYNLSAGFGGLLFLLCLATGCSRPAPETTNQMSDMIQWEKLPDLPGTADTASLGVSAPFAGVHKGKLIVAGGCNFPDKPVSEGGLKRYYEEIFVLAICDGSTACSASDGSPLCAPSRGSNDSTDAAASVACAGWKACGKLPYPVAYGATVSTPSGVVCIGGNNSDSSLVRVACLSWDEQKGEIETRLLPSLPAPMDNLAAAFTGTKVYVGGGNENGRPARTFLCLDLAALERGWERLPDFPGCARVQPVLVAQQSPEGTKIYLAGGFQPIDGEEAPIIPTDVLAFDPATNRWAEETSLPRFADGACRTLTGGCGVAFKDSALLFMGGVNYDCFLTAIDRPRQLAQAKAAGDAARIDSLQAEAKAYLHHPVEWYRFNTALLQYNTYTKEWTDLGSYEPFARAGAGAVSVDGQLIIVNGELKPGIRTPQVNRARL